MCSKRKKRHNKLHATDREGMVSSLGEELCHGHADRLPIISRRQKKEDRRRRSASECPAQATMGAGVNLTDGC